MAAITGNFDFWNMTSQDALQNVWLSVSNGKTISATVAVLAMIMCLVIVCGNFLIGVSIWKDPLKTLRSSPSNLIILSMAIADLLVGLVACPLTVYWGWALFHKRNPTFESLIFFSVLVNVSVGHILLLSIDRFIALVTPLQYRVKVSSKRICLANVLCWVYFVLFGCAFAFLQNNYIIMGTIYNVQFFSILTCILIINFVTLFRFHKYSRANEALEGPSAVNPRLMLQRESALCKAIATIICAFLVCFVPWFVLQILIYVCIPCSHNLSVLMLVYAITAALMYANSAVNPFLYAWRLPKYRDTLKHLLKKRIRRHGNESNQVEDCIHDTRF